MADIINLRQARKAKRQADDAARAEENRILHGRTKSEKELARASKEGLIRKLDGHKLSRDGDDTD